MPPTTTSASTATMATTGLPEGNSQDSSKQFQKSTPLYGRVSALRPSSAATAIFASNDDMAAGVLTVAHRRGISVPADLSVAGFDDTALASQLWPTLTTVRQPTRELAYAAASLLFDAGDDIVHRRLPHELVLRASTAAPRNTD